MFGYTNYSWQSAISPAAPPRPIVDPLAGGYRKIPVAQIGADIFCDTRIISAELAELSHTPELDAGKCARAIQEYVAKTDSDTALAVFTCGTPLYMAKMLLTNFMPWEAARLVKDRAKMSREMSVKRYNPRQAKPVVAGFVADLEQRLSGQPYLFGDSPCIADFSAFHLIWFGGKTQGFAFISKAPQVRRWFKRISQMGHGNKTSINKSAVFEAAREGEPRALSPELLTEKLVGQRVKIGPNDYAQKSVIGTIAGGDDFRWVLARETDEFGRLHVHFPKQGFELVELD